MSRRVPALAVLLALLVVPAGAAAAGFEPLYRDFKKDGAISSCRWSDAQLRAAERDIPADVDQYAPAFAEQIAVARDRHARGDCEPGGGDVAAVAGIPAPPPAEIPADTGVDVPLAVGLLGWLLIVAALVAVVLAIVTRLASGGDRRPLAASIREAGERFGDLAREFWDWLRLGR
jgi:hypothetical protein